MITQLIMSINRDQVQEEALKVSLDNDRCTLGISMGVGKTRIAIKNLQERYDPFISALVVVPKLSIRDSWIEELKKLNLEDLLNHISFVTYLSLNKKDPSKYDIVYLDECHSILESHISFLDNFKGKILGLTGTPPNNSTSIKYRLLDKYCPVKYTFTVDEATDSDILNDYRIIVHKLKLSKLKTCKKKNKKTGGTWFTSEHDDYNYVSQRFLQATTGKQKQIAAIMRMKALQSYYTKEEYAKSLVKSMEDKVIVFANTKEQADRVAPYSFYSGNTMSNHNLRMFANDEIPALSCILQLSEGVTIPNLKQGIIMHAYGNERKSAQRIGRLLRLNPDETATCHILCYKDTVDEKWVDNALKEFDDSKIKYYDPLKATYE